MKHILKKYITVLIGWLWLGQGFCVYPLERINSQQLQAEMNVKAIDKDHLLLINVLPKKISADCHIPGSINIPYHLLARKTKNWPKDSNIVIYCAGLNCPLAKYGCEMLLKLGFSRVRIFDGGLRIWKSESLPTIGQCKAGYLQG